MILCNHSNYYITKKNDENYNDNELTSVIINTLWNNHEISTNRYTNDDIIPNINREKPE